MTYDPKKVKRQIQAESEIHVKFGPGKLWSFIVNEIFHNDEETAKEFLLSDEGGFDPSEIKRMTEQKQTHKEMYNRKLECGVGVF